MDGDLGSGDSGTAFLQALLPVMKQDGGECHWYDFAADHEFPDCDRTRRQIEQVCETQGLSMEVIHVANVGSIAKRQLRVCMDFRIFPTTTSGTA
jgi:tRNA G37 N-methylase Trm5